MRSVSSGRCALAPPTIGVSPASLSFSATAGGANPGNQSLSITNTGGGTLSWTAGDDAPWLSVSPVSGTAPSTTTASVNMAGLAAGTYNGTITISATGATNTPLNFPVTLTVNAATLPDFSLSASPSSQTVAPGDSTSYNVNVTRFGGFSDPVDLSLSGLPAGLGASFSPNPATGSSSTMTVTTSGAAPTGSYTITITGTSGVLLRTTTVTLVVNSLPVALANGPYLGVASCGGDGRTGLLRF